MIYLVWLLNKSRKGGLGALFRELLVLGGCPTNPSTKQLFEEYIYVLVVLD